MGKEDVPMDNNSEVLSEVGRLKEIEIVEFLNRVDLDLAYSSEKLLNLSMFLVHVTNIVNDSESPLVVNGDIEDEDAEKALQLDHIYGIVVSQVKELETFMVSLEEDIMDASQKVSSLTKLEETVKEITDKLHGSMESLKQSQLQISEIKMQMRRFQRALTFITKEKGSDCSSGGSPCSPVDAKWRMQTMDQQSNILRMLEGSLARELELDKKLVESKSNEDKFKSKLNFMEREVLCLEEEEENIAEKLLLEENLSCILMAILQEKMGNFQTFQSSFNLLIPELEKTEAKNLLANSEVHSLTLKVATLERELKESNMKLGLVCSSLEGSEKQKNMLHSELYGMERVVKDLKERISKAETRAVNAEINCEMLTEDNQALNEDRAFLRNRIEILGTSLHEAECAKLATAKDINNRAKIITDLVLKLSLERERLQAEIGKLAKESPTFQAEVIHNDSGGNCKRKISSIEKIRTQQLNYKVIFLVILAWMITIFITHMYGQGRRLTR